MIFNMLVNMAITGSQHLVQFYGHYCVDGIAQVILYILYLRL